MKTTLPLNTAGACVIYTLISTDYAAAFDLGSWMDSTNSHNSIPTFGSTPTLGSFPTFPSTSIGTNFGASFNFGFRIDPLNDIPTLPGDCGISGIIGPLCSIGNGTDTPDPDTTPFYQGQIVIDGVMYWHIIIGDPNSGFAMESYTQQEFIKTGGFGSFSGGKPTDNGGLSFTPSFPAVNGNGTFQSLEVISGNGWDPLGTDSSNDVDFTGNGSGDPRRTVFRQVMGDGRWDPQTQTWSCNTGEFCSDVVKARLDAKPVINQTINSTDKGVLMQSQFQLDMSNSSYADDSRAGAIINWLTLTDLDPIDRSFDLSVGNFNMSEDIQEGRSTVTGGRYIYHDCANKEWVEGSCWQSFSVEGGVNDYQEGSYSYISGGTDPMGYDWSVYLNPLEDPFQGGNKLKCEAGASINTC